MLFFGGMTMELVAETYAAHKEASASKIRVRPLPGQGFDGWNVECSKAMRESAPVGQHFLLWVTPAKRQNGKAFLYGNPHQAWRPISESEALRHIRKMTST